MVLSFGRHGWLKPDARVSAGRSEEQQRRLALLGRSARRDSTSCLP